MACTFFNPCVVGTGNKVSYIGSKLRAPAAIVCMKQPMDEVRKMSNEAIDEALDGLREKLSTMRSLNDGEKLHKPREYRRLQIRVSRLMAVKRERDLERGIVPLQSRTLRRAFRKSLLLDDLEGESFASSSD